jgi:hypothetical protein
MMEHTKEALIIGLPLGRWPQDAIDGNTWEVHRSTWDRHDFDGGNVLLKEWGKTPLRNGVAIYPISDEAKWVVRTMKYPFYSQASRLRSSLKVLIRKSITS